MSKKLAHEIVADVKRVAEEIGKFPNRREYFEHGKFSWEDIYDPLTFGSWTKVVLAAGGQRVIDYVDEGNGPKVLFTDIETAPLEVLVFSPWEQNIRFNQVLKDWSILSVSAKWLGEKKVHYWDNRHAKNVRDDRALLKNIWELIDEADIVVTQNGKRFDVPKLNARFILNKMQPPSSFKQMDTKVIAKKHFGFTYNSQEYLCEVFDVKHKKLKHEKFAGIELWKECLKGNPEAWAEMERYNRNDVLGLEEIWEKMRAWDSSINFNLYTGAKGCLCRQPGCGGQLAKNKFYFTNGGKFQRYRCTKCGAEARGRENLFSVPKKAALKIPTVR